MDNADMIEGRFLRLHRARRKLAFIRTNLEAGRTVYICTAMRATKFKPKWAKDFDVMFRATKSGAYVARGKNWDCIDYCRIVARSE